MSAIRREVCPEADGAVVCNARGGIAALRTRKRLLGKSVTMLCSDQ